MKKPTITEIPKNKLEAIENSVHGIVEPKVVENIVEQTMLIIYEGEDSLMPSPEKCKEYEVLMPGYTKRIFDMAEKLQAHNIIMEKEDIVIEKEKIRVLANETNKGQNNAIVTVALASLIAIAAIINNMPALAGIVFGVTVTGLVAAFIKGRP